MVPAVRAPPKPVDPFAGPAAGLRVLVADDSREIAESMEMLLTMDGFDVLVALDGEQAFEQAQTQRPEVALLDLGMPKRNGCQVAQRIREQPWGRMTLIAQAGWGPASTPAWRPAEAPQAGCPRPSARACRRRNSEVLVGRVGLEPTTKGL